MKVVHVPFGFYPDPVGGTEAYVEALSRSLNARGLEAIVAAPSDESASYLHGGLPVRRFAVSREPHDLVELYGEGDALASRQFAAVLDEERPDILHMHAFTRGASVRLVREAKRRGLPVVFTYHTPTVSCQRGTLMRWGREVCAGTLERAPCSACALQGLGLGKAPSRAVGNLPPTIGRLLGTAGLAGGLWTALRMSELVRLRHSTFHLLMAEADHVVVLARWTRDVLLRNSVPAPKITVSPHGLPPWPAPPSPEAAPSPRCEEPLRVAFLGRLDPAKGPDILIRAVRALPGLSLELHLFGISQGPAGRGYRERLEALAAGDPRIAFRSPVPGDRVVPLLRGYDVVAVPSQLLETGPLVVLEAFAAGVPVLGSGLGGIAELVRHGVDGFLVDAASPEAWRVALRRLAGDRTVLAGLRAGIRPPRAMGTVADEMAQLYHTLANQRATGTGLAARAGGRRAGP